jgi:chorismate mutase/prephenate dehydratase
MGARGPAADLAFRLIRHVHVSPMTDQRLETPALAGIRAEIDRLDREIVALLNRRARMAVEAGRAKVDGQLPVFDPQREAQILHQVADHSEGPLTADLLRPIYREVLSACRHVQRPLQVAYLGPAATFAHMAAMERFGHTPSFVPANGIGEIFSLVQKGEVEYGVVPVENSTEGPVLETLDLLVDAEVRICSAVTLPVVHNLLASVGLEQIQRVYSHPQALAQCRRWLAERLPGREIVPTVSTARGAEQAAADPTGAAIATALAAEKYGLTVQESGIQDLAQNFTRFFVISREPGFGQPSGQDRTAILFSIRDRVGALRDVVDVFASAGLNLSSIQSRPSKRRAWDYIFFVELVGHASEPRVQAALSDVERHCVFLKVLGSWPIE